MKSLEQRVLDYIGKMRLLQPGDRVGVAVSGGADSVALLHLLSSTRGKLGIQLLVVHFDHRLRGAESDADADFVSDLARSLAIPLVIGREDVAAAVKQNKWNLEDGARRLRYAFFERVVRNGQATRIGVAHTADDQAETVLAHLIRGTGPTGLAGIHPVGDFVVRPLLAIRREELRGYLRRQRQTWREDSTNLDEQRVRARIRARLLPLLEREFSPGVVGRFSELARLAGEEQVFWNALTDERFQALFRRNDHGWSIQTGDLIAPMKVPAASLKQNTWESSEAAVVKPVTQHLIRRVYQELRGSRQGLAARHVEQVIELASFPGSGRRAELPGGVIVENNFGDLTFALHKHGNAAQKPASRSSASREYAYTVELPGRGCATVSVPELQRRFRLKLIDWTFAERETIEGCSALDADRLRMPLILRNWRPGDAYRPRGRRQIHKLKQMFAAGRIPVRDRAGWPILESGGQIVWALGMPAAREFSADEGTAIGVVIEEERL
ncbi:MAG TPA: tRNA lysidine(34) synthetase TilS [Candidatus Dormibacteraeota bacterium]|nr:tRNA lysidine(34) synthetase TilS [Candidatus Dormibacteraeota bacterium]